MRGSKNRRPFELRRQVAHPFQNGINSLQAKLSLMAGELQVEQLELKRRNDSIIAQGKIDMSTTISTRDVDRRR